MPNKSNENAGTGTEPTATRKDGLPRAKQADRQERRRGTEERMLRKANGCPDVACRGCKGGARNGPPKEGRKAPLKDPPRSKKNSQHDQGLQLIESPCKRREAQKKRSLWRTIQRKQPNKNLVRIKLKALFGDAKRRKTFAACVLSFGH